MQITDQFKSYCRATQRRGGKAIVAACLLAAVASVQAHTFCVDKTYDSSDPEHALLQALIASGDGGTYSGQNNSIEIVRGTYVEAGVTFEYYSTDTHKLDIGGGYNADCSALMENPELTVLDGNGQRQPLFVYSAGDVSIRWLTLQNGHSNNDGGALEMVLRSATAQVILEYNIFRGNSADQAGGAIKLQNTFSGSPIYIEDNLIVGNSAPAEGAIFIDTGESTIYFINNTIAQNTTTGTSSPSVALSPGNSSTGYFSNNILWGNTATYDLGFDTSSVRLVDNVYKMLDPASTPASGSSGNLDTDPQFVDDGSFRLLPTSPSLGTGTLTPVGNLPTIDIEGYSRSFTVGAVTNVDRGAYERGDEILKTGFDN